MAPDYTDQIEGRKTMSAIEGNPICFEFTDELQKTLAMYPRKLDSLAESISVVFVGKVDSVEHAKSVVAKSKKLNVSTKVVTHWAELLSFMWKNKYGETDKSVPTWDDQWAGNHDGGDRNGQGEVPRVILESINECVLNESAETDEVGEVLGDQIGFGEDTRNTGNDFGTHCINPCDRKTLNFICTADGNCKPVNMYKDDFFSRAFPTLFPYGYDGRQQGVSLKRWAKVLLKRKGNPHQKHYSSNISGPSQ
jgi:hypothetical protein